jgi:two-component system LytT family response regulator
MIKNKLKTIIIDDNKQSIKFIETLIDKNYANRVNVDSTFSNPLQAFQYLENNEVDIVFIDILMPKMTGIEFIELSKDHNNTHFIVISSHTEYGLQALKLKVYDYLTKPIDINEFKNCIDRLLNEIDLEVFEQYHSPNQIEKKLLLHTHDKTVFLEVKKILRIESDGSYCSFMIEGDPQKYFASKNLKYFEDRLANSSFYRLNRSNIINVSKIAEIQKSFGDGIIVFSDGNTLNVNRIEKDKLIKYLKNQFKLFF